MYSKLLETIDILEVSAIPEKRKQTLYLLIDYIQKRVDVKLDINLNFICTHNSRRSHLAQIWAQTMAHFYKIDNVQCFSGGTETTALFPKVIEILKGSGFKISKQSEGKNPTYHISYSDTEKPLVGFSKTYDDTFNPKNNFASIMTCSHANKNCPFVFGCDARIALTYNDPKAFDDSPLQNEKYLERSLQIAAEMKYVFSKIKTS